MSRTYSAGVVTAYGAAKRGGYTGTYEQFCQALGDLAEQLENLENLSVTVSTLPAGSSATASYANGVLTLGIPKGDTGATGPTGPQGPAATVEVGTVTTLPAGSSATVTNSGSSQAAVFNFGIPKGDTGEVSQAEFDELSGDVEDLKTATSHIGDRLQNYDGYLYLDPSDFRIGTVFFGTNGWDYYASLQRVVINEGTTIKLKAGDFVTLSDYSDARFCMGWILPDGTRKSNAWVKSGGYTIVDDAEYGILLAHKTEVNLNSKSELLDLLTIYRKPNTQTELEGVINDVKFITGSPNDHLIYAHTYTNTGTGATAWAASPFPAEATPKYFRVASAENVGTGITNYGQLFAHYSDGTTAFVTNNAPALNVWMPVNLATGKTVTKYDCVCSRGSVSEATTSTWRVEILCGDDIRSEIKELEKNAYGLNNPLYKPCAPRFAMHRGYSTEAPENTVPAFILAGKAGAYAIETDIQETSDGVFVCFHDSTVDRMTDGTGTLYQKTYAQVQALTIDAGANIGNYPNLKIPTLEEYLTVCRRYGCVAFLHMGVINHINEFVKVVTECGMLGSCVFLMGYDANRLKTVRTYTNAPAAILKYSTTSESVADVIALANSTVNCAVSFDSSLITDSTYIKECHALNMPTNVWVIDNTATAEQFFALGVDTITSNSIPKLSNE